MNDEKRERISWTTGGFMIGVALMFDAFQAIGSIIMGVAIAATVGAGAPVGIPIMMIFDWMVATTAGIGFWIWFLLLGVNIRGKRAGALLTNAAISAVIEAVPLLDLLPAITFGVARTIFLVRAEDALHNAGTVSALPKLHPHRPPQAANDNAIRQAA